jgi:hypothetical protein
MHLGPRPNFGPPRSIYRAAQPLTRTRVTLPRGDHCSAYLARLDNPVCHCWVGPGSWEHLEGGWIGDPVQLNLIATKTC